MEPDKEISDIQKRIFAENLQYFLELRGRSRNDIMRLLSVTSSTVSDWMNANKYPRVDKMQIMADYLNVKLSDLREKKEPIDNEKERFSQLFDSLDDEKKRFLLVQMEALLKLQEDSE